MLMDFAQFRPADPRKGGAWRTAHDEIDGGSWFHIAERLYECVRVGLLDVPGRCVQRVEFAGFVGVKIVSVGAGGRRVKFNATDARTRSTVKAQKQPAAA